MTRSVALAKGAMASVLGTTLFLIVYPLGVMWAIAAVVLAVLAVIFFSYR